MIPDELFEQLLQEFSSDPVHDYILKTFSSSPLKPNFFTHPWDLIPSLLLTNSAVALRLKGFIIRSLHLPKNS